MVHIITLPHPRLTQTFVDYMATQGIKLESEIQDQHVSLWLQDDSHITQVKQELQRFLQNPVHPRYQAASWRTGSTHHQWRSEHAGFQQNTIRQAGTFTISIVIVCVLVYLLKIVLGNEAVMGYLAWPNQSQYGQLWRYFSPAFLHFSLIHILFNVVWWWYLGSQVEKRLGRNKLVQITLVSALISGWSQSLFSGINFGGLSGVVYALLGYVWWCGERAPHLKVGIPRGLIIFSVLWLLAGYFSWFSMSIANAAHSGGLIIGLLMGFWDFRQVRSQ